MDYQKIIDKLGEYKKELLELKEDTYSNGEKRCYEINERISMIIRRVYPEKMAKEIHNRFFACFTVCCGTPLPEEEQRDYLREIDKNIKAIDTIKEEFELFGFDNFKPLKKETETTLGLGKDTWGFKRKTTKKG